MYRVELETLAVPLLVKKLPVLLTLSRRLCVGIYPAAGSCSLNLHATWQNYPMNRAIRSI
jgi:hypothetical protein